MKKILSAITWMISKITGKRNLERLLIYSAKSINVNLHQHGLLQIGAGTTIYLENGGELFFIKNILASLTADNKSPLFFDIGANVGNYTLSLQQNIPYAKVYAFEPVKDTFTQLEKNVACNAKLHNIGFGDVVGKGTLYNTLNTVVSEITTTHKDILLDIFKSTDEVIAIEFDIDTIDNFCASNGIKQIDFLKIDVEGNELAVLQGAGSMIANDAIKIIQFEFNTHNVYARVFLKDFYGLLKSFMFYRLNRNSLISLGDYKASNEIFTAQNIVAIHKTIAGTIDKKFIAQL